MPLPDAGDPMGNLKMFFYRKAVHVTSVPGKSAANITVWPLSSRKRYWKRQTPSWRKNAKKSLRSTNTRFLGSILKATLSLIRTLHREKLFNINPFRVIKLCYNILSYLGAQHKRINKKARLTNHVERLFCTMRQRISRLVRSSLSFSKKLGYHVAAIKYFLYHYNLAIEATL